MPSTVVDAPDQIEKLVDLALAEDLGSGDVTSLALVPRGARALGVLVAKAEGVVFGLDAAEAVFRRLEGSISFEKNVDDGARAS